MPEICRGTLKDDSSSREVISRIQRRDVAALAVLYDRHATGVYRLACHICRNRADAEDVVQEVFLQVWQQASRFDHTRSCVESWLLMITRSRALDRVRRTCSRSLREEGLTHAEDLLAGPEWASDLELIREENGRGVRHEFEALPVIQRIAVELAFYEGLTHSEIADVLCQPLGTVKTRIRVAIRRMRDGLNRRLADTPQAAHEPSPFTIALAEYLAKRPILPATYRSLTGLRILAVDDDEETVDLVATVLQSAGGSVMTARSTPDGLARLDVAWPDVILADISMPFDDGYALIRNARAMADASGRRLTAIAFTALGDREHEKALRAGFATLVAKPVQPHALLDAVARVATRAA